MPSRLAIKIDVDTDRGTREGVLPLVELCRLHGVPATFFFSLGPDNTGKAIRRIFRPGFFSKVMRTRVASNYGWRTMLNGTLLPAPHIGRRNEDVMKEVRNRGFEVGIHCYDHFTWQDYVSVMPLAEIRRQFQAAQEEFVRIFGVQARSAAAPGWQCSPGSLAVYDEAGLLYASDARGRQPFLPSMQGQTFRTLQIPTTLPTLDELLGRPEFPPERIVPHYLKLLKAGGDSVLTIHAELEGLAYLELFGELLKGAAGQGIEFYSLEEAARVLHRDSLPVSEIKMGRVDGRSGTLAVVEGSAKTLF
ncbi:MAG: polysaccharide deacetylase family protein [Methylacidiphilales bacterium]|nr:polysaccharide deacetylase family protein [Candidatus Methylacidiphilales bacterium]